MKYTATAIISALILSLSAASALASVGNVDDLSAPDYKVSKQQKTPDVSYKVKVVRNLGLVAELAVTCGTSSIYLSYSVTEKMFCDPKFRCSKSFLHVAGRYCSSASLSK